MSLGEEKIASILTKAKIPFEREKTFKDLKCGTYRYDFFIEDLHGRRAIIEYNGRQHYECIKKFYPTTRHWMMALERDRKKISYALANDIDIYIIPYFDFDRLQTVKDLFLKQYKAKNRWHNDEIRQALHQKS